MVAIAEPRRHPGAEQAAGMHRDRIVDRIRELNPSASQDYLCAFSVEALALYLDHLESAGEPRGRGARWVRPGDTRAIVCWEASDSA